MLFASWGRRVWRPDRILCKGPSSMSKPLALLAAVLVVAGFTLCLGGCASNDNAAQNKPDHPKADHPR